MKRKQLTVIVMKDAIWLMFANIVTCAIAYVIPMATSVLPEF